MVNVKTEILINTPLDKLVDYVKNPDSAPEWYDNIKSVEWKSPKPLSIGSKIAFTAKFLGKNLAYVYEVVELNDKKMIMQTAEGPFPMKTTYEWETINPTSCKMTLRNEGKPSGFSKFFSPIMEALMRKANNKDLLMLKSILEGKY